MVAASRTLDEMTRYLPHTLEDLEKMFGFGEAKIKAYGQDFLDVILQYCEEQGLGSLMQQWSSNTAKKEASHRKGPRIDTKAESFKLFKAGNTIPEIAQQRKLAISTIESHLVHYVSSGEIDIKDVVSPDKILLIEPVIKDYEGGAIAPIKEKLGTNIGFGDIRMVLAWQEYQKTSNA
jgi:ATP-dependent DNA helicase RecQ